MCDDQIMLAQGERHSCHAFCVKLFGGFVKDWSAELSVIHMQVVPYIKCLHLLTAQHSAMPSFALIPRFLSDFDRGELPYAMGLRLPSSSSWHSTQAIASLDASVMMM